MFNLRLSPSGPIIGGISTGFRLRLAESRITVSGGVQAIPTTAFEVAYIIGTAPPLIVGFAVAASPNKYRATCLCDVRNTSNAAATVQLDIFADFTGGGYNSVATSTHQVLAGTARQIRVDAPLGIVTPANATQALFKAFISNSLDANHVLLDSPSTGPTIDFQVEEMLA